MKNLDIIIPSILKIPFLCRSKLKLLNTDWYPVFLNQTLFESMGYKIRFFTVFDISVVLSVVISIFYFINMQFSLLKAKVSR